MNGIQSKKYSFMGIRVFYLILMIVFFAGCTNKEKVTYHTNGNVKIRVSLKDSKYEGTLHEYNEDGSLKSKYEYSNGERQGISVHFYEPGYKFSKSEISWEDNKAVYQKNFGKDSLLVSEGGLLKYNFKIGTWKFYGKNGQIDEKQEFINVDGEPYLNQNWKYNQKGDTIGGNYYKVKTTFSKDDLVRVHFFLAQPLISYESELYVCLPKGKGLKNDFSNEESYNWDTIYNLEKRFKSQGKFMNANHDVVFDLELKDSMDKNLKGFLLEKSNEALDTVDFITRKIYFDLPLKDSDRTKKQ